MKSLKFFLPLKEIKCPVSLQICYKHTYCIKYNVPIPRVHKIYPQTSSHTRTYENLFYRFFESKSVRDNNFMPSAMQCDV